MGSSTEKNQFMLVAKAAGICGGICDGQTACGDGTYLATQILVEHDSDPNFACNDPNEDCTYGQGFTVKNPIEGAETPSLSSQYQEGAPKDVITALPGQITKIQAKFDKPGVFVWHCHILSHEDHEMMRTFEVV